MSISIVNPQCGEIVYTLNPGHVCQTLPDHRHCTPEDCLDGEHAPAHCLVERGPERTTAVQVQKVEIRKHTFAETSREPVIGQVNHIEARGLIAIEECPTKKDPEVCARAPHRHVTEDGEERCVLLNYFPITLHMDLPVGDGCLPFLGDNLIVHVRRAYGRLEHAYRIE